MQGLIVFGFFCASETAGSGQTFFQMGHDVVEVVERPYPSSIKVEITFGVTLFFGVISSMVIGKYCGRFICMKVTYLSIHCNLYLQVHRAMCAELLKIVDKVSSILPEIEAARPRCSDGIKALCSLNCAIGKANILLQHCSESSKLYLVGI